MRNKSMHYASNADHTADHTDDAKRWREATLTLWKQVKIQEEAQVSAVQTHILLSSINVLTLLVKSQFTE